MVGPAVQMRFVTSLTDEEYVSQRAWNDVQARPCPWCKPGTCQLAPHGFYARVKPKGAWIRRFICRRQGRTVSLLPDCLAAHVTGSLEELEAAVAQAGEAATRAAAGAQARPPGECSLASAQRWLQRRMGWVEALLVTVKGLCPERFAGVDATLAGFGQQLDSGSVLRSLREVAEQHLQELLIPVGFRHCSASAGARIAQPWAKKQYMGLDPPAAAV